jgi:C4-dicarboxylate-specific signal transduction histidine kinase
VNQEFTIFADFGKLEQVLLNLLMNSSHAIKKAKTDGRINHHFLAITARTPSVDKIQIIIEDSGCGISIQNLAKLFKPFFTTKQVGEGTGLGLTIVSQLVQEMQGSIWVESLENQGTRFFIEFKRHL